MPEIEALEFAITHDSEVDAWRVVAVSGDALVRIFEAEFRTQEDAEDAARRVSKVYWNGAIERLKAGGFDAVVGGADA
jgi:hypothetical protein